MVPFVTDQNIRKGTNGNLVLVGKPSSFPGIGGKVSKKVEVGAPDRLELCRQFLERKSIELCNASIRILVETGQRGRVAAPNRKAR